jgi:hypothetical protein
MFKFKLIVHCIFAVFTLVPLFAILNEHTPHLLFIPVVVGAMWFGFWSITKPRRHKSAALLSGTGNADLEAEVIPTGPQPPPRPVMAPPPDGGMSVAIHQTDDAVWVWILVTEVTKQTLSKVLKEPVDQFPDDPEATERMMRDYRRQTEHIAKVAGSHYDKYEQEADLSKAKKMFSEPTYIHLRHMLANPFRYPVSSPHAATEYIDRLKTKVLPKIKTMIQAQSQPKTESFEL